MENIIHTVKEKMKKTYSFSGTQLVITGLGVVILLSIFASAGRHGWPRHMNNNMRGGEKEITQQYNNRQWINQRQMIDWDNQEQPESMMNNTQDQNIQENQNQTTSLSDSTGTGN